MSVLDWIIILVELMLVICAAFRGWKGWALLPIVIGWGGFFLLSFLTGSFVFTEEDFYNAIGFLFIVYIIMNLVVLGVLIGMIASGRKEKTRAAPAYPISPVYAYHPGYVNAAGNINMANFLPACTPQQIPGTSICRARLVLPDRTEIPLTEAARSIGRIDFQRLVAPEALNFISSQQFWVRYNGRYFLEDTRSANGTRLNGISIRGCGLQEIRDGDQIDVAGVAFLTFKCNSLSRATSYS